MFAVSFEYEPAEGALDVYLDRAATLRPMLAQMDGFVSVESFENLTQPGKLLSLSFWCEEAAVAAWRIHAVHRDMQSQGRSGLFGGYRLRVAGVIRDYGMHDRELAPADQRHHHDRPTTSTPFFDKRLGQLQFRHAQRPILRPTPEPDLDIVPDVEPIGQGIGLRPALRSQGTKHGGWIVSRCAER